MQVTKCCNILLRRQSGSAAHGRVLGCTGRMLPTDAPPPDEAAFTACMAKVHESLFAIREEAKAVFEHVLKQCFRNASCLSSPDWVEGLLHESSVIPGIAALLPITDKILAEVRYPALEHGL